MNINFIPATTRLTIEVAQSPENAIAAGFVFRVPDEYTGLRIEKAVVVRNGTADGKSTVDLILVDAHGNKYVTMITSNLLKSIPD